MRGNSIDVKTLDRNCNFDELKVQLKFDCQRIF